MAVRAAFLAGRNVEILLNGAGCPAYQESVLVFEYFVYRWRDLNYVHIVASTIPEVGPMMEALLRNVQVVARVYVSPLRFQEQCWG